MTKQKSYTGKDIVVLSDREHVRLRTQIYLGNMQPITYKIPILTATSLLIEDVEFIPAVYKAIGEIIDNSLDEFAKNGNRNSTLSITAKPDIGNYTIADNGRGIPIEKKIEMEGRTGKEVWVPEIALARLRAGRNFTDDKEKGVIGMNGVGAACTNFCSTDFEVTVERDKEKYYQKFTDGADKISKPKITAGSEARSGTTVKFQLDPAVFKDVALPAILMENRAVEIAMTNPGVTVIYNETKHKHRAGLKGYIDSIGKSHFEFTTESDNVTGSFFVFTVDGNYEAEQMFTWVNGSLLFDGGMCNTQFVNSFYDKIIAHLTPKAKKLKCEVSRADIRQNMVIMANLQIKNPEYDSQSKTRLTGPNLKKDINEAIETQWTAFCRKHAELLDSILERANRRFHKSADSTATQEHEKSMNRKIEGLLDATSKFRGECKLLITEGLSAKSQISEARDSKTIAAYALTGKINNVYGTTAAQLLKMGKVVDLLAAIGLVPGKKANRGDLRYGQVVITTDADYDGSDIFTLLVNIFFQFWPELFDPKYEPFIYRLSAPNVCLVKGKHRVHFINRTEYEKNKHKHKGYEVRYYKGLGSMNNEDWEMILNNPDCFLPVTDDGKMNGVLKLLFSDDSAARQAWLSTQDK